MSEHTNHTHADRSDALVAALAEIERHVQGQGWNQPVRLFALVRTDELIRQEPSLAAHLAVGSPDALSSVEQEDFHGGDDLASVLGGITWPASVAGCAVAVEKQMLPKQYEHELPDDLEAAATFVAQHPHRVDVRVVAGALRDRSQFAVARLASNPDDLLGDVGLAPDLSAACAETLR